MQGDGNANVFDGSDGADELWGRGGDDFLVGGIGDDVLHGGGGLDELFGVDGIDTAHYGEATARVDVDLNRGVDQAVVGTANVDQLDGIENITGGNRADLLRGDGGANTLDGGAGDDVLHGRGGNDTLLGGADDDRLRVGSAAISWTVGPISTRSTTIGWPAAADCTSICWPALRPPLRWAKGSSASRTRPAAATGYDGRQARGSRCRVVAAVTLFGWSGPDELRGGSDDRLGGSGDDDLLTGGADADTFVFISAARGSRACRALTRAPRRSSTGKTERRDRARDLYRRPASAGADEEVSSMPPIRATMSAPFSWPALQD